MENSTMSHNKRVESISLRVPRKSSSSNLKNPRGHFTTPTSDRLIIHNRTNFKRSAAPSRIMFYQSGSWVDFQSQVLVPLRSEFSQGKPIIDLLVDGALYTFDFLRMVQIDVVTGNQRSISWIDEKGKCCFPKVFVDEELVDGLEDSRDRKIEIRIQIDGELVERKRELEGSYSSRNEKQENVAWKRQRLISTDLGTPRWPNSKLLRETEKSYSVVSKYFLSGMMMADSGVTITAIHQSVRSGPLQKARLQDFQKLNETVKAARGASNLAYSWYGASSEAVADILSYGFGMPTANIAGSPTHGVGVHLSHTYSPYLSSMQSESDENGEKHIILCRVILGNLEKVEAGSEQSHPSSVDFDNGVDDPLNPNWFVVWCTNMNRHILPEFVVSYKSSTDLSGQLGFSSGTKCFSLMFFAKIWNSLPSSKFQELLVLYNSHKAGKLAKENFVKQL